VLQCILPGSSSLHKNNYTLGKQKFQLQITTMRLKVLFYVPACGIMTATLMADRAAGENLRHGLQDGFTSTEEPPPLTFLDLSKPFTLHPLYNNNACAGKLIELASNEPEVRGMVVLEQGQIVTEYYKGGETQTTLAPLWSCTKAFTNLMLGVMIKDGILSLNETLGDVFEYDPYDWIWGDIEDAEDRKALTIESIITMTAGLSLPRQVFVCSCTIKQTERESPKDPCSVFLFLTSLTSFVFQRFVFGCFIWHF